MKGAQETRLVVADVVWTGTGAVHAPGVVEIEDGRIVAVGPLRGERPVAPMSSTWGPQWSCPAWSTRMRTRPCR